MRTRNLVVSAALAIGGHGYAQDGPWTEHTIAFDVDGAASVFSADVDGDNDIDLLSASFSDGISWFENTGGDASTWTEHLISTNVQSATFVHAADIDGDLDVDVATASFGDDKVAWFENTAGDGSAWTEHVVSSNAVTARTAYPADIDGDLDLDLVSASSGDDKIAWYENTAGDGSIWTEHVVSTSEEFALSAIAADIDGDQDLDIASASLSDDTVAWYENTAGDGSLWTKRTITSSADGATDVDAADIDGDGDMDVLVASQFDDTYAWYENQTGGGTSWAKRTIDSGPDHARSIRPVDMDGDDDLDVVTAAQWAGVVAWYENRNGGSTWVEREISTAVSDARDPIAVDLDEDGDLDVVSVSSGQDRVTWHRNDPGACDAWVDSTVGGGLHGVVHVAAADVDGDDDIDALAASWDTDAVTWFENANGDGSGWTSRTIASGAGGVRAVFAADIDGDDDIDALSAAFEDGRVVWYDNTNGDGTTWTARTVSASVPGALSVSASDLDGDDDMDVISASRTANEIAWHENTAGGGESWTRRVISSTSAAASSVFAADIDGDQAVDVVSASFGDDTIAWHENAAGDGSSWTEHAVSTSAGGAISVFATDVDGDADLDILSASRLDNTVAWHENTSGDGRAWTEHVISASAVGVVSVYAADADGDGHIDVFSAAPFNDKVAWNENLAGDGSAWAEHVVSTSGDGVASVVAADLDGDGDTDALSAAELENRVRWHRNVLAACPVGERYCDATVNSTGQSAALDGMGSPSVHANNLVLVATDVPTSPGVGIFIAGPAAAHVPFFNGNLCIDPVGLQRINQFTTPTAGGVVEQAIDYTGVSTGTAPLNVTVGEPYHFQYWFRDPDAGGGHANFSHGLLVLMTM